MGTQRGCQLHLLRCSFSEEARVSTETLPYMFSRPDLGFMVTLITSSVFVWGKGGEGWECLGKWSFTVSTLQTASRASEARCVSYWHRSTQSLKLLLLVRQLLLGIWQLWDMAYLWFSVAAAASCMLVCMHTQTCTHMNFHICIHIYIYFCAIHMYL